MCCIVLADLAALYLAGYTVFMTRGILIAGNKSPLFSALGTEASRRVNAYAAALIPSGSETASYNAPGGQISLDWNPSSPISARALVLSAMNRMGRIDDAILVCVPPAYRHAAEDISAAEIDMLIDNNIKGWFFLIRELTAVFKLRKSGSLGLVLSEPNSGVKDSDLLGVPAAAAFKALAGRMLAASLNAPYTVNGFSSPEYGEESAFAAHVFKVMEQGKKNSGRWHKYGKFGIFGR